MLQIPSAVHCCFAQCSIIWLLFNPLVVSADYYLSQVRVRNPAVDFDLDQSTSPAVLYVKRGQ